ncbi:HpcH/HpaI aldolase family protein [Streptosporangium sp. NBC_01756]|uniref:HpcH/HpaI aldolase family protein n=1 Tax=Streptosporangium sp. NBC_01756 TaxID=2975950 RepID=UPI002DD93FD5|nr:aldolase/citrate lyase family protein [Streptosporangium sp. NBC_01756]WSC87948.1 aldolase/citrate lyase family protein [Streptosporangium sp. NBC_01756]
MTGLRERLRRGRPSTGVIVRMPATGLIELAGHAGMDFVVLDCEHGPADLESLQHHLAAAESSGLQTLVRVGGRDPVEVQRVLDLGATGIVAPHVTDAADAAGVVASAHYPPLGERGLAVYTRAGRYGLASVDEHLSTAAERTMVVAMVEDGPACAAADEIAGVDGVDAVLVGPGDLAMALGVPGQAGHPSVAEAIGAAHTGARSRGKAVMAIVSDPTAARAAVADGALLVVYNLQAVLTGTMRRLADATAQE